MLLELPLFMFHDSTHKHNHMVVKSVSALSGLSIYWQDICRGV